MTSRSERILAATESLESLSVVLYDRPSVVPETREYVWNAVYSPDLIELRSALRVWV